MFERKHSRKYIFEIEKKFQWLCFGLSFSSFIQKKHSFRISVNIKHFLDILILCHSLPHSPLTLKICWSGASFPFTLSLLWFPFWNKNKVNEFFSIVNGFMCVINDTACGDTFCWRISFSYYYFIYFVTVVNLFSYSVIFVTIRYAFHFKHIYV